MAYRHLEPWERPERRLVTVGSLERPRSPLLMRDYDPAPYSARDPNVRLLQFSLLVCFLDRPPIAFTAPAACCDPLKSRAGKSSSCTLRATGLRAARGVRQPRAAHAALQCCPAGQAAAGSGKA